MGQLLNFDIHLNNPTGIYQPGDSLSGQVIIKTQEDVNVNGVHLWVLGQSDVSWSDKADGKNCQFDYEIYMKDCLILWGRDPRDKTPRQGCRLPGGCHEYNFQYPLSRCLPSSFESQDLQYKGRVYYLLRAKLDSSDENLRLFRDKIFIVLSTLDLNKEPRVTDTVQLRKEQSLCCCCCKSGPVSCSLRLDRTAYVPGEDINLDAEIQNLSRKEVTTSYVTMQQYVYFHVRGVSKCSCTDIFRISGGKIRPGDSAFFHDIIHIPPLPPSRLDGCSLIDISYSITVGVLPSSAGSPVECDVPVIIGTKPLKQVLPQGASASPSFSRYSHSSGEIEDYDEEDYQKGKYQHVYTYYKSLYKRAESIHSADVT